MMEVSITYNDEKQIEKVRELNNNSLTFHFIDMSTLKGRREGYRLKGKFGARLDPFIMCYQNNNSIKGFWSEASEDVISDLINYLKHEYKERN